MGFISKAADKVRNWVVRDKERAPHQFAKGATGSGNPSSGYDLMQAYGYDVMQDFLRLEHDLLSRFVDYEEMDDYPEISSAIDIYADDATQMDSQTRRTIWVTSKDKKIEKNLDCLFHKTLRMDEEIWEIARTVAKYGNDQEEILINDDGVVGLNFLPPPTVRRIEGPRGELFGFIQDFKGRFGYSPQEFQQLLTARAGSRTGYNEVLEQERVAVLEDWEVAHFRLRGKHRRSVYGYSVMESARWIWKRLMLLEDAALIYRLQRAPERYAFYCDVGDLPPQEAWAWLNRQRQQFKKKKFINPSTGKLDLKFEALAQDEDIFIPVRKGQEGTRVEVLGAPAWQHMEDIEYFLNKLFAAMKVPKAYLAQDDAAARAVLSSEDVRFARTVLRVQRELRNGLSKIARVHLAATGVDPATADYDIHMTTPSAIFELAQLEVRNARADLASRMQEFVSLHWMLSHVFGMSDEEIEVIVEEREEDKIRDFKTEAKAQKAATDVFPNFQQGAPAAAFAPMPGGMPGDPNAQGGMDPNAQPQGGPAPESYGPRNMASLSERLRARNKYGRGISEKELFRGNREAEKRAEGKLDRIMRSDRQQTARMIEIRDMLQEVVATRRRAG